jgi:hypothetical protein
MMNNQQIMKRTQSLWVNGRIPTLHTHLVLRCPAWRPGKHLLTGLSGY